jgi:hypothetical protein
MVGLVNYGARINCAPAFDSSSNLYCFNASDYSFGLKCVIFGLPSMATCGPHSCTFRWNLFIHNNVSGG